MEWLKIPNKIISLKLQKNENTVAKKIQQLIKSEHFSLVELDKMQLIWL